MIPDDNFNIKLGGYLFRKYYFNSNTNNKFIKFTEFINWAQEAVF